MTPPGNDTPDPADASAATAGPAGRRRRVALVLAGLATVVIVVGLVAVRIIDSREATNPLDADAPALADFDMQSDGDCSFDADRGGLVAHFEVSTQDTGRFTIDVEGVTDEGADNLDITTTHAARYSVSFDGGQARKEFDVVVPLTEAEYQDGYRSCRYAINGSD